MTIPPWPSRAPAHGSVHLREVGPEDVAMARELSTDPYVPQTGSLIQCLERLLALTGFGWTVPGLARIVLHVESWNIASQRTAERAGYVRQEATADHRIFNGETREMVVYETVRP